MHKQFRVLFFVCSLWVSNTAYGQVCDAAQIPANLRTSLRAYYPFCGNYQDISGNGYHGTPVGNVPFIADRNGATTNAIQGGGGYIPTSNQFFRFSRNDTFTVSVWFTVPANGCPGRLLSTESPEGHFRIGDYGAGAISVQFGDYIFDTVTVDTWHHLVYVYANRNERVYIDGVLKKTNYETVIAETLSYTTPFTIGAKAAPNYDTWCGKIDDVGVWARALNDCEVKQLYLLPYSFTTPIDQDYFPFPATQNACADNVVLNAFRTGCTYRWNTGDTTAAITVRNGGFYTVAVKDTFGCKAYDSIQLKMQNADIVQGDTTICAGDSVLLRVASGNNDPAYYDFNTCVFSDFVNVDGGGAASTTINGKQGCGLYLDWPAVVESERKSFSYGMYEVDMKAATNFANQYLTVLGSVVIDSRPSGTDDVGYGIYVNGQSVKISNTHPATYPDWYHLRVNVTPDSVMVWVDNTLLYAGKYNGFGPAPLAPITIGTYSASLYDNVRYTPFGSTQKIRWSTGDTTRSIVVRPGSTTTYTVRITDYGFSCSDSVLVTVNGRAEFDPLPDTLRVCEKRTILDGGTGLFNYLWSNGSTAQRIEVDSSGYYRLRVIDNNNCRYDDTVLVSLLTASILQLDTAICPGRSVTLYIDSLFPAVLSNQPPAILASLSTYLQAYYPFSGNPNDYSKNNYTGYASNTTLTTDRFGNPNSAYQFNGVNSRIFIPYQFFNNGWQEYTISLWFSPASQTSTTGTGQTLIGTYPRYASAIGYSNNGSRQVYHSKNANPAVAGWDILNADPFGSAPLERDKWYHVILVKRGLTYSYYLDGRLSKQVITTIAPLAENCTLQLGAMMPDNSDVFNGKLDEVMIFDKALDTAQLQQLDVFTPRVRWSTGDTTNSITVTPDQTTVYRVTVSNGLSTCADDVRVFVIDSATFDIFADTISVCADSFALTATYGGTSYRWNTGDTTSSIMVRASGKYKVTVFGGNGTCKGTDSTIILLRGNNTLLLPDTVLTCGESVLLDPGPGYTQYAWSTGETSRQITVQASGMYKVTAGGLGNCQETDSTIVLFQGRKILQADTTICRGNAIVLRLDSTGRRYTGLPCTKTGLPPDLQNGLVAYYPFCGDANDAQGANHGIVYNAQLTADRNGKTSAAYHFDGASSSILPSVTNKSLVNSFTYAFWARPLITTIVPQASQTYNAASSMFSNPCVIHPIHGITFGANVSINAGSGIYVGTNGLYVEEHSDGWEAVPLSHSADLTGWHQYVVVYENKVPSLYIDGKFIKAGIPSTRNIYASLGKDEYFAYTRSGIGAGYSPPWNATAQYFNGDIDDVLYYGRALRPAEVAQLYSPSIRWSTGETGDSITVRPSQTTIYYVTVSNGIDSCTDSVRITVNELDGFDPLPDTIAACGDSVLLDAGAGFISYTWSTGARSQTAFASKTGYYAVNVVNNQGCEAADSVLVSILRAEIAQHDTVICKGQPVTLSIADTSNLTSSGWELIMPAQQYTGIPLNFTSYSFDPHQSILYSVSAATGVNAVYRFDLNNRSVAPIPSAGGPALVNHVFDFTNNRLIANRVGRDAVYALPLTGGTWTNIGNGAFDTESYGCSHYWNPVSGRYGYFGGYGFYQVKNWVWESNPGGAWQNTYVNNNGCNPAKRTGQIARNRDGTKCYIFSGQGSCDGNQYAAACALGSPWATDVGTYCWLRDLWELDFATYTFRNILPANSPSVQKEGAFAYDFDNNTFYSLGGYVPSPVYNPNYGNQTDFTNEVYRFRPGIDIGFSPIQVKGTAPPLVRASQYYGTSYYDAKYQRLIWARKDGIWALNLAGDSLKNIIRWSTGDTTARISVSPDSTTTYYVTVSNGISSCTDSIKVTVDAIPDFNPLPDSICVCADSILLDAGPGFASYQWNTGHTTQRVTAYRKGWYKVTVTNANGCEAADSVYVRRVNATILQSDTLIKALTPVTLSIDTTYWTENGFTVRWSTGDSSTSIIVSPRQKTKYYVYVSNGSIVCTDSITINVKCISGYNCTRDSVAQCNRSVVLDAGAGYLSYLWSTGDTTRQITVTKNGLYRVIVFDSSEAFGEDSAYVNLLGITIQPRDTTVCEGSTVQLVARDRFNGNDIIQPALRWSTGVQDTAITVSPSVSTKYYATLSNALQACRDSAMVNVVIIDTSLTLAGPPALCAFSLDSVQLQAGRGKAYQWLRNGVPIAGATQRTYKAGVEGKYAVIITDTLGCQDTSRSQSIVVYPSPAGTFLPPATTSFCEGDSLVLAAAGAASYQWYRNGIALPGATAAQYKTGLAGTYAVVYVSANGCTSPGDTITLQTRRKPKASFAFTTYCAGIPSEFTSTSDTLNAGNVQYRWKFADGTEVSGPTHSHTFTRSGNYSVQLILTSFDCVNYADTSTQEIRVQAPTPGKRYATLNLTINVPVSLAARSLGTNYLWTPAKGLDNPRIRTPRLTPVENTLYLVTISNAAGCVTIDTVPVQVFDGRDIFVARGFTPNNDNTNDRLYPIVVGIVEIRYFRVYNRWGNLVFQSSSLLPQDGWDGAYNGKAQPSDTYTWMVEGVDIEGKLIRRSGSSVLIR